MFNKGISTFVFILASSMYALAQRPAPAREPSNLSDTTRRPVKTVKPADGATRQGKGSQIVDDSTKNVYGPKTTLWVSENDIFTNKIQYKPLDTALSNYHRWTYIQRLNNFYHDLGNVGTALNSIYPFVSQQIGATPGFSVYQLYYDTEEPLYYDTKSPFTTFRLVWGGEGRAATRVEFSRNINPQWNFGFNFRSILVDKQIQRAGKGDRQTRSYYYDLYSSYKSKDGKYYGLASVRRLRHRVAENGGIFLQTDTTFNGYFADNAGPYLTQAETEVRMNAFHVYQQYQLASPFQLYLKTDVSTQWNGFKDNAPAEPNYDDYFSFTSKDADVDTVNVWDGMDYSSFVNEAGIKGNAAFLFYNFYYKVRQYSMFNRYVDETKLSFDNDGIENYVGGRIAFRFDSLSELSGRAEYLLDGNYLLEAQLKTPWLDARGVSSLAKPVFMSKAYRGSHNSWVNDFSNTFTNQLEAFLKARWRGLYISPGARYTLLNDYIYYKENKVIGEQSVVPAQSSGNQQIFSPEVRMELRFLRHLYFRPQVIYTSFLKNDDNAVRIPEWFVNTQFAFENHLFKRNILVQIGVDAHWRSAYTALGYNPALQQFYVQDGYVNDAYPLVDLFFNGAFKRGRFFVKYHNIVQLIRGTGYLPTPTYRGQSNILDFGFDLILFD